MITGPVDAGAGRRPGGPADGPGAPASGAGEPLSRASESAGQAGQSPARGAGPWRAAFFGLATAGILAIAVWAALGSSLFVVHSVTVRGSGVVPKAEVVRAAGIRPGTPLARVSTAAAARRVEAITQVQSAQVSRDWPGTVVISVTLRRPALAVASGAGYTLIDKFGVALSRAAQQPPGMVLLTPAPPAASLRGNRAVLAAVTVLGQLPPQLRSQVTAVTAQSPDAVTLHLRGGITVVWGSASRSAAKAAELAILMQTKASFYDLSDPATAVTGG